MSDYLKLALAVLGLWFAGWIIGDILAAGMSKLFRSESHE